MRCLLVVGLVAALALASGEVGAAPTQPSPLAPAPEERAEEVLVRARALIAADELAAAEDTLRGALLVWPEHHDLQILAGWTASWRGDAPRAVADFEAALALVPDSLDGWDGLAVSEAQMGRPQRARAAQVAADGLDPDPRSREERALRVQWAGGNAARAHVLAARLVRRYGRSETTEAVEVTPWGFDARGHARVALRDQAPLARFGGALRVQPHAMFRFWLRWEASTWLGDRELTFGGGAQLLTPAGFSLVVHGGGGAPGVREAQGEVGVGLGWRFARLVEVEGGWTFRRWSSGTFLHLLRVGASLQFPSGTRLGGALYMGLVAPAIDPKVRPAPGVSIRFHQPVQDPIAIEGGYSLGTEIIVVPSTRAERTLLTHRIALGMDVQATARLGFLVGYALEAWAGQPPFHGLELEVRAQW